MQRDIFQLKISDSINRRYDPLVIEAKVRELLPDAKEVIREWNEHKTYSALSRLTTAIVQIFALPQWSEQQDDGLLSHELFGVWKQWCDWCERIKKNTSVPHASPPSSALPRQPAPMATTTKP